MTRTINRAAADDLVGKVWVVDDSPAIRDVCCRILREHGIKAHPIGGPYAMLTSLDAVNPRRDLLLTDIDMPGMSGRDLAHQVLARFPSLRVLLMSAQADNERLDAVGAAGPDLPILEKPFKIGALIDMVERALAV